jgi:hypothetical protein
VKVTPKIAEALVNLRGNRDFQTVLEGLKEHALEETDRCIDHEGSVQLRAAGAVKALHWWVDAFQSAPKDLEKFKNQLQQGK